MMAFSGVRSSWDMFARNCDLCWLASATPARGLSPGPAGTGGRSRSPAPTGWRTSGAGRRPPGGTRPGVLRRITSAPTTRCSRSERRGQQGAEPGRARALRRLAARQSSPSASSTWTALRATRARPTTASTPRRNGAADRREQPARHPVRRPAGRTRRRVVAARRPSCRRRPRGTCVRDDRRQHLPGGRARETTADLRGRLSPSACSSAVRSCSSSKSRAFSMAMTAWSANVSSSAICRSVNGGPPCARSTMHADRRPRAAAGT